MVESEIIKNILDLAKKLLGISTTLKSARKDDVDRLATYCEKISECLGNIHKEIREGGRPVLNCGQLGGYIGDLDHALRSELSREERDGLSNGLRAALNIEMIYIESSSEPPKNLDDIAMAAGKFKALADGLRVKS